MTRPVQLAVWFLVAILLAMSPSLPAAAKKKPQEPQALLMGTTFTAEGLSLPGVPMAVTRKGDKKPKWRASSDARGEFAVRVPAGPASYEVATESKEHENQSQEIEVQSAETVTVVFRLARKSEGKP